MRLGRAVHSLLSLVPVDRPTAIDLRAKSELCLDFDISNSAQIFGKRTVCIDTDGDLPFLKSPMSLIKLVI